MASENVKITILEDDITQPQGSGTSTDVAFIPAPAYPFLLEFNADGKLIYQLFEFKGDVNFDNDPEYVRVMTYGEGTTVKKTFCVKRLIVDRPILCDTLSEFYQRFGEVPYMMSAADATKYTSVLSIVEGDPDRSFIYATELLQAGMSVVYRPYLTGTADIKVTEAKITTADALKKFELLYDASETSLATFITNFEADDVYATALTDMNEYGVKYITSGGYPSFYRIDDKNSPIHSFYAKMLSCAATRGDAVALIDHEYTDDFELGIASTSQKSFYGPVNTTFSGAEHTEFGAMFTPWADYTCSTMPSRLAVQPMPASFGYLKCMATAIKTSPNWLAMAGVTRGKVPGIVELNTKELLSNTIAEEYQPKYGQDGQVTSINAITNIKPYGLTIWGNRTLKPVNETGTTATNFLNIRNMVSDIKKLSYRTAKSLMFEQDTESLWLRFKGGVSPLLEQLKSSGGVTDYKIIRGTTKYNGKPLTKGELAAVIKIFPIYAVEYFEITVVLADNDVTIA